MVQKDQRKGRGLRSPLATLVEASGISRLFHSWIWSLAPAFLENGIEDEKASAGSRLVIHHAIVVNFYNAQRIVIGSHR